MKTKVRRIRKRTDDRNTIAECKIYIYNLYGSVTVWSVKIRSSANIFKNNYLAMNHMKIRPNWTEGNMLYLAKKKKESILTSPWTKVLDVCDRICVIGGWVIFPAYRKTMDKFMLTTSQEYNKNLPHCQLELLNSNFMGIFFTKSWASGLDVIQSSF